MNKKIRKVAIVTGTRAEYGILKPLIEKIHKDSELELELIVTGMHLLRKFGYTIKEIEKDGYPISSKVKMYTKRLYGEKEYYGISLGKGVISFTKALEKIHPDILLVFGDRLEALAATLAASSLNIPIGHIHAGDKTDSGHIDEQVRFAISRFSHILFAPTKKCTERLIKMGEESWRIHTTGALNLDSILSRNRVNKKEISNKLNVNLDNPTVLVLFHPIIHEHSTMTHQMEEIMKAIVEIKIQAITIYPNNDMGSEKIIEVIERYSKFDNINIYKNLEHEDFINLMQHVSMMIGNSSSGIIEAASLGCPVINVGSRNRGRDHGGNVLFVKPDKKEIQKLINKILNDSKFIEKIKKMDNPWGDGRTAERIIHILKNMEITDRFMRKKITY